MRKLIAILKSALVKTNFGQLMQLKYGSQSRLIESSASLTDGKKLNLACGELHIPGFINIDSSEYCNPDMVIRTQEIADNFAENSIANITIIHGLGYLSFAEAKTFFRDAHNLLKADCELVIETPSLDLVARKISVAESDSSLTPEMIYPLFATGYAGPTHGVCYQFAWTKSLLGAELLEAGFRSIRSETPLTHGQLKDRDMRIIAIK